MGNDIAMITIIVAMDTILLTSWLLCRQPPMSDSTRPSNCVDSASVMPVVLLGPSATQGQTTVSVRVLGVPVLIEVRLADLRQMPTRRSDAVRLQAAIAGRHVTLVRLAGIPPLLDCADRYVFPDVYFAPACINETEYIFERCAKRGDFLNVMLLLHFSTIEVPHLTVDKRRVFVAQLLALLDECKEALLPSFQAMVRVRGGLASASVSPRPIERR